MNFFERIKAGGHHPGVYPKMSFWRRCRYILTDNTGLIGWRMETPRYVILNRNCLVGIKRWSDPPGPEDTYLGGLTEQ